jgi:hypothetical protein
MMRQLYSRASAGTERGGRNGSSSSATSSGGGSGSEASATERLASAAVGGGERRTVALLLASEASGAEESQGDSAAVAAAAAAAAAGSSAGADGLWLRMREPLSARGYSANALCTLSDGAEQWAAALGQHVLTSRVVLAAAPAATLQRALAAAFGDGAAPEESKSKGGNGHGHVGEGGEEVGSWGAAARWLEALPGCVLLDKAGAAIEQAEPPATAAPEGEDVAAVVYRNVVCCPWPAGAEAALAAVCAAADSGSGPTGLL